VGWTVVKAVQKDEHVRGTGRIPREWLGLSVVARKRLSEEVLPGEGRDKTAGM
jgi:hypothetical protein